MQAVIADDQAKIAGNLALAEPAPAFLRILTPGHIVPEAVKAAHNNAKSLSSDTQVNLIVRLGVSAVFRVGWFIEQECAGITWQPVVEKSVEIIARP